MLVFKTQFSIHGSRFNAGNSQKEKEQPVILHCMQPKKFKFFRDVKAKIDFFTPQMNVIFSEALMLTSRHVLTPKKT
jgi:hypothetical protein